MRLRRRKAMCDCVALVEEERLSVRVYDIGQSRDSRCQYKFNEDLIIENKELYPDCITRSAAYGVSYLLLECVS